MDGTDSLLEQVLKLGSNAAPAELVLALDSLDFAILHGELEEQGVDVELDALASCRTAAELLLFLRAIGIAK